MLTAYAARLGQAESGEGEQAWFLSWLLEDAIAMEASSSERIRKATKRGVYLGVEGSGGAEPFAQQVLCLGCRGHSHVQV